MHTVDIKISTRFGTKKGHQSALVALQSRKPSSPVEPSTFSLPVENARHSETCTSECRLIFLFHIYPFLFTFEAGSELRHPPASASRALGLKVCAPSCLFLTMC